MYSEDQIKKIDIERTLAVKKVKKLVKDKISMGEQLTLLEESKSKMAEEVV